MNQNYSSKFDDLLILIQKRLVQINYRYKIQHHKFNHVLAIPPAL
jgi:hypothetical protein